MLDMDIVNAAMVRQRSETETVTANAANAANRKKTELNQEDFLTLMISQLKNQDPFKPLDPSQYVGQLAQFSSVSGLADMNKNITALADANGYVYAPAVNVVEEMVNMISASRSYQNNVEVMNTSKDLLLATLRLGQG